MATNLSFVLKRIAVGFLVGAGLAVLFHAVFVAARTEGHRKAQAECEEKCGRHAVLSFRIIDGGGCRPFTADCVCNLDVTK